MQGGEHPAQNAPGASQQSPGQAACERLRAQTSCDTHSSKATGPGPQYLADMRCSTQLTTATRSTYHRPARECIRSAQACSAQTPQGTRLGTRLACTRTSNKERVAIWLTLNMTAARDSVDKCWLTSPQLCGYSRRRLAARKSSRPRSAAARWQEQTLQTGPRAAFSRLQLTHRQVRRAVSEQVVHRTGSSR